MTRSSTTEAESTAAQTPPRRSLSIGTIFATVITILVAAPLAVVVILNLGVSSRNTFSLLEDRTLLLIDSVETAVQRHLEDAALAVDAMNEQHRAGTIDLTDEATANAHLRGAISALPNIEALVLFGLEDRRAGAFRDPSGEIGVITPGPIESDDIRREIKRANDFQVPAWGELVFRDGSVYANYSALLQGDDDEPSVLAAAVSMTTLSQIVAEISRRFDTTAFILDSERQILAHPTLVDGHPAISQTSPTVPLATLGDPVLASFPDREVLDAFESARAQGAEVASVQIDDQEYIVIHGTVSGFGPRPWTIGAYFLGSDVSQEVYRLQIVALVSVGALITTIVLALVIARRMSRPIERFTRQASLITDLDLDKVSPLPRSRVREFDRAALAFNTMLDGLKAFAAYVPKSLVSRLIRLGIGSTTQSSERELTIMFTDIVGFTAISEHMSAAESADFLNHHFQILSRIVEKHGGTVDKFMGDGMLAFWGAPEPFEGHAEGACKAALEIASAIHKDNALGHSGTSIPVRIRIGLHTGHVIVGNVGGDGRINYTIVGDAVNVTQRLQDFGRNVAPQDESIILVSAETAMQAGESFATEKLGTQALRGREAQTTAFRLTDTRSV